MGRLVSWVIDHGMSIVMVVTLVIIKVVIHARGLLIYRSNTNTAKWRRDQLMLHVAAALTVPLLLAVAIVLVSPRA